MPLADGREGGVPTGWKQPFDSASRETCLRLCFVNRAGRLGCGKCAARPNSFPFAPLRKGKRK